MRALDDFWGKDPGMTIEMCRDMAIAEYLRYYGVQYGVECYATNSVTSPFKYGLAPIANCSMSCAGNPSQRCGGDAVNDVYDAGASPCMHEPWGTSAEHVVLRRCVDDEISKVAYRAHGDLVHFG
jgi:hypothetical protein